MVKIKGINQIKDFEALKKALIKKNLITETEIETEKIKLNQKDKNK